VKGFFFYVVSLRQIDCRANLVVADHVFHIGIVEQAGMGAAGHAAHVVEWCIGLGGNQEFTDNKNVNVYGYGIYGFVPIIKSSDGKSRAMTLSLETQAYSAAGLDVLGATAMSVTGAAKPNLEAAKGYGMFAQLKFYPIQDLGITAGYGRRETLDWDKAKNTSAAALALSNAPNGAERSNQLMFTNVTYDLNAAVRVAAELERIETSYNAKTGQNNSVRLAAYYFF